MVYYGFKTDKKTGVTKCVEYSFSQLKKYDQNPKKSKGIKVIQKAWFGINPKTKYAKGEFLGAIRK